MNKYTFGENAKRVFSCRDKELLVEGAAGTGKTLAILVFIIVCAHKYNGMRAAIIRKTRTSMTQTVLKTLENKILPPSVRLHSLKQSYRIGDSEIVVGGMDKPEKVLSSEYDLIYVNEATEISQEDLETLTTRLRNGVMPYQQIIVDCNPSNPLHWLNLRANEGLMTRIKTTHKDNLAYWNPKLNNWTEQGRQYLDTLERLGGAMRRRFLEGVWAHEEGAVYDVWLDDYDFKKPPSGNVTDEAEYQKDAGIILWAIDDGYTGELDRTTKTYKANSHPRVFLLCQLRKDGRLCVFAESYAIKTLDNEHLQNVLKLDYPKPDYAAVDKSAAQLMGLLNRNGIATQRGASSVDESIKEVRAWAGADENGYRRLLVHPRCRHLRYEFASYRYGDNDKPLKEYDHGLDALRYLIWRLRYERV